MSFGLSPSDIINIITLSLKVYNNYKNSGDEYELLTKNIECFKVVLVQDLEVLKPIRLDVPTKERLETIISNTIDLLNELNSFCCKYSSLGTNVRQKRDKFKWNPEKAKDLTKRISFQILLWDAYTEGVSKLSKAPNYHHSDQENTAEIPRGTSLHNDSYSTSRHQSDAGWDQIRKSLTDFGTSHDIIEMVESSEQFNCRKLLMEAVKGCNKGLDTYTENDAEDSVARLSRSSTLPSYSGEDKKTSGDFIQGLVYHQPYAFKTPLNRPRVESDSCAKVKAGTIESSVESRLKSTPFGSSAISIGQQRSPFR